MLGKLFAKKVPLMVGIDIGSHSVKAVLLTGEYPHTVEAIAIESMPKDVIQDRNITDIEEVGKVIARIRKKIPKTIKYAAAAVSGSTVITKVIFLDAQLSDDEMESQIELEADSLIPYPLDEVNIDFERLGLNHADATKENVLLSAARKESVEARTGALDNGGFTAKVVDIESYCSSRAAELCLSQFPHGAADKLVGVINIGHNTLLLSVLHKGETIYTRDQNFGGQALINELITTYQLEADAAEMAATSGELPDGDPHQVFERYKQAISQQVRRSIQMFVTTSGKDNLDYLLVAGGVARMKGLVEQLQQDTGLPTQLADPFNGITVAPGINQQLIEQVKPQLMIATGLALRSFSTWHI